jgi:ABC-2 type transport system permease protein
MSIVIVLTILSEMNIPIYDKTIRPYLFTTHMVAWKGFFYVKSTEEGITINGSVANLPAIVKSLSVLVIYIAGFLTAAIWVFRKKDILS